MIKKNTDKKENKKRSRQGWVHDMCYLKQPAILVFVSLSMFALLRNNAFDIVNQPVKTINKLC